MVFDRYFFLNYGLILFNTVIAFFPYGLDWSSPVQLAAIIFIASIETRRQLAHRRIIRLERQIAENELTIEEINALLIDPVNIPLGTFIILFNNRYGLNFEDSVNWKRDGF